MFKAVQSSKKYAGISVILSFIVTVFNAVHPWKTQSPISVAFSGKVISVKLVQS